MRYQPIIVVTGTLDQDQIAAIEQAIESAMLWGRELAAIDLERGKHYWSAEAAKIARDGIP